MDPNGSIINRRRVRWIKRRPERSEAAEAFIRLLDSAREQQARVEGRNLTRLHYRCVPMDSQKVSEFQALPTGLPIDYYDSDFFNQQQPRTCRHIAICQIAFLPDVQFSFQNHPDERLSDNAFMTKYGEVALVRYMLPEEEDEGVEWLEDDEEIEEEFSSTNIIVEDEEMGDICERRSNLANQLSEESV